VFDFPDASLKRNTKYYIVVRFGIGSEYAWSGAFGDPYTKGMSSRTGALDWDYAFKTIVDKKTTNVGDEQIR